MSVPEVSVVMPTDLRLPLLVRCLTALPDDQPNSLCRACALYRGTF